MLSYILADNNENNSFADEDVKIDNVSKVFIKDKKKKKINFGFNIEYLDLFCRYSADIKNKNISKAGFENLRTLLEITDIDVYEGKHQHANATRIRFALAMLSAKLDKKIDNMSVAIEYTKKHVDDIETIDNEILPMLEAEGGLSNDAINYSNESIYEYLINSYAIEYNKQFMQMATSYECGEFKTGAEFSTVFNSTIKRMSDEINSFNLVSSSGDTFSFDDETFDETMDEVMDDLTSPSNRYNTGIQYLTRMLNHLESRRVYLFMGLTGIGKSVILLTLARHIIKYNKCESNSGKRPVVLYITQENSINETVERIFNMTVTSEDIRNFSKKEVKRLLREKGEIGLNSHGAHLVIKYFPNKSITSDNIEDCIDSLASEGKEVIALVHDYIGRLRSKIKYTEMRHELGEIVNDLHALAVRRNIPVISAAQLNRNASSKVENTSGDDHDLSKLLGKQDISESYAMIQNLDVAVIINREYDYRNPLAKIDYMVFKLAKFRGRQHDNPVEYFVHPFKVNNKVALLDDYGLDKPLSKDSMTEVMRPDSAMQKMRNEDRQNRLQTGAIQQMMSMGNLAYNCGFNMYQPQPISAEPTKADKTIKILEARRTENEYRKEREIELKHGRKSNKYNLLDGLIKIPTRKKKKYDVNNDGLIIVGKRKTKDVEGKVRIESRKTKK